MMPWKRSRADERTVERRIRAALAEAAPLLNVGTAGVELVAFELDTGVAVLRFEGDCPECDMPAGMLRQGIESHLRRHIPEIRAVRAV